MVSSAAPPSPSAPRGAKASGALRGSLGKVLPLVASGTVYALVGWFWLRLGNPVSHATPLFPAAGVALVCVLVYGWPAALGVTVGGAVLVAAALADSSLAPELLALVALGSGVGVGLQAITGSWLVRRFVGEPLSLSEPRQVLLFFVYGGGAAGLISASSGTAMLAIAGVLPPVLWWATWATWWSGNVLGVIVAAPIALSFIGRPRAEWLPRRRAVGLTLVAAIALLTVGMTQISQLDAERTAHRIEREAGSVVLALRSRLQDPLRALEVTRGIFLASNDATRAEMHRSAQQWLYTPGPIKALGWGEFVGTTAANPGSSPLAVSSVASGPGLPAPIPPGKLVVRYIEPFQHNASMLGRNLLEPASRRAPILRAIDEGGSVAGEPVEVRLPDGSQAATVTLYSAVHESGPQGPGERAGRLPGVVFVAFRVEETVAPLMQAAAGRMDLCLVDRSVATGMVRLAGAPGCERDGTAPHQVHALPFAGRTWELRVQSPTDALAGMPSQQAWLYAGAGLLSAGMVSALLLLLTGRALHIEQAVADRTRALSRQVREREQAEAARRESEQRFRNIFDNVSIGVVYADLDGVIQEANSRYAALVGCSVDELIGTRVLDRMHAEERLESRRLSRELIAGKVPLIRGQHRMLRQDGTLLWVQQNVTLLRDDQGAPQHLVGVVEDISDQLRLVEAERAREAAEAANRAKSDFLSRMSHELRTPLNAMLGFAQLLGLDPKRPLSDSQQVQVAQIQQAGWHLLAMINDVLDLSRVDSDNLRLQIESLELRPLVEAAWALVAGEAARRRLVVSRQFAADDPLLIRGDATRVKQILTNLLSNAVKYNVEAGRIVLSARTVDGRVELSVDDSGPGMTPAQLGALFQPFNRLGRERSAVQGTGIGLLISRRLAELMGGTLDAHSSAGRGSSFVLGLPASGLAPRPVGLISPPPADLPEYHRRLVHYVEDNPTNVEVMRGLLAQRPQVQLTVSVTGLDGLAAIRAHLPDLILLDMHLPDIDGIELLRYFKSHAETARIPVIVVSADALAAQIESAFDAGASHYLTKPLDFDELLRLLDSALGAAVTRH